MQRYRGHFFNWYDTRTLQPLAPRYISTVDSGNLAGYLVTLRAALLDIGERVPVLEASFLEGLVDLVSLVEEELTAETSARAGTSALTRELAQIRRALEDRPATPAAWKTLLSRVRERLAAATVLLHEIEEPLLAASADTPERGFHAHLREAGYWLDQAAGAVSERMRDLERPALQADIAERAERLASLADDLVEETEFDFLFDEERQLFSIGFNIAEGRLDASYYDTLRRRRDWQASWPLPRARSTTTTGSSSDGP
jgi:hypothetical protein